MTRVVDGDTVDVRFMDGTADTVRLLGVDAPEVGGRNEPGEFEGVSDTDAGRQCLADAARDATAFVEGHLADQTVRIVLDEVADRRGDYGRLLAYVVLTNGTNLNYRLVETGHARVYDADFTQSERFYAAESRAQSARRGLWRCRDPDSANRESSTALRIVTIHADAEGNDHENLDDEYVVFRNAGPEPLELDGWTVSDAGGHVYAFPAGFRLEANASVTLYTGRGRDSADSLYWGSNEAVWNNDGDEVVVRNATEDVVIHRRYR